MMSTLTVSIIILLLCNYISSDTSALTRESLAGSSANLNQCTNAAQCPVSDACIVCDAGRGPDCEQATCINGQCGVIQQCSQKMPLTTTTPTPPDQCTGTNVSQCVFNRFCELCIQGLSPFCTQVECVHNQCKIIPPCSIRASTTTIAPSITTTTTPSNQCTGTNVSQCVFHRICAFCTPNLSPSCTEAVCVNNHCKIIPACSIRASATTIAPSTTTTATPSNQCTGTNASQCVFHRICAFCTPNLSPSCTQAVCVNNHCKIIPACSIRASTTSTEASTTDQCENDGQCFHPDYCVVQCKDGTGPLCASAKCVNKKCQTISPCSQTIQCTNKNLSRCSFPKICALCKVGLTPSCTQATCINGQCGIITPCSQKIETKSTAPPASTCTYDDECPHPKSCAVKCRKGTTPRCASAKCVNGKCIIIKPCSEHTCETQETCPYNKCNCAECPQGYGPECEQPACSCGICSIVPPCSEKIPIVVDPLPTSND